MGNYDVNTSVNELLNYSLDQVVSLKSSEEFTVSDLFMGYVWKRLSRSQRSRLGLLFMTHIQDSESIIVLGKSSQRQQIYKKA